jgi:hypothetical protein
MQVGARVLGAAALVAALAAPAAAQDEPGEGRFFFVGKESKSERQSTTYDGSLTSTTFYYREFGSSAPAPIIDTAQPASASPVDRLFTDVRAQLDAKHMSGSKVDFHGDLRARKDFSTHTTRSNPDDTFDPGAVPAQGGTFGGDEYELRELYVRRDGAQFDITLGRHFVLELAATKIDGLQVQRELNPQWRSITFLGLYPSRISRDIREDYPTDPDIDPDTEGAQPGERVMPVAGGQGAAYRLERVYGAFGVVGIAPLAEDESTGTIEKTRVFAHSNGYWRPTAQVDLFHYAIVDALGAAGAGLTNLTLGLNYQPKPTVHTYLQVSRIDTETLNVHAQTKLEDPDPNRPVTVVQNNIEVQRIAQDQARVGISVGFKNRFEVSTSGALRRRPELTVSEGDMADPDDDIVFPAAQGVDITLSAVDRRSFKDMRIGLSATRSFSVGNVNLYRSKTLILRADASREVAKGKGEVEGSFTVIDSRDDNRGTPCTIGTAIEDCYGSSNVQSFTASGLAFYRFKPAWFVVGSVSLGRQLMGSTGGIMGDSTFQAQPAVTIANLFLRLAYRF